VYVPYLFDREEEPFTHMPISTGLAAGPTYEACVEKGVLEVLERDALMTRWLHELPAPAVDPETCRGVDPLLDASLSAGEGTGASGTARWHLNLITVDIPVPVVTAALIDDEGDPMTSMGVAAHRDPVRALLLAVEEALLTRVLLSRASELRGVTSPPTEATTLRGHMLAHACDPELRRGLDRVIGSGRVLPLPAVVARFRASSGRPLAALLGGAGLTAWSVDLTTPDVAAVGLSVARTLVPGLQPLDNDHRHRHLGGRRLASVPAALGVPGRPLDDLNPLPHPFP
jgi:ribosomal protein S12 methylthiotransferase accessory factor